MTRLVSEAKKASRQAELTRWEVQKLVPVLSTQSKLVTSLLMSARNHLKAGSSYSRKDYLAIQESYDDLESKQHSLQLQFQTIHQSRRDFLNTFGVLQGEASSLSLNTPDSVGVVQQLSSLESLVSELEIQLRDLETKFQQAGAGLLVVRTILDSSNTLYLEDSVSSSRPSPERWVRLKLAIPAGFQNGAVFVDGAPARVVDRLPNRIDIEGPSVDRPITVRVEARGKVCEQSLLVERSSHAIEICAGVH